jgi:hypothetical protein
METHRPTLRNAKSRPLPILLQMSELAKEVGQAVLAPYQHVEARTKELM